MREDDGRMKKIVKLLVTDIIWDAKAHADLPGRVVIDINDSNAHLLDDIDDAADALSDWLSDEYGYCHKGFCVQCVYEDDGE